MKILDLLVFQLQLFTLPLHSQLPPSAVPVEPKNLDGSKLRLYGGQHAFTAPDGFSWFKINNSSSSIPKNITTYDIFVAYNSLTNESISLITIQFEKPPIVSSEFFQGMLEGFTDSFTSHGWKLENFVFKDSTHSLPNAKAYFFSVTPPNRPALYSGGEFFGNNPYFTLNYYSNEKSTSTNFVRIISSYVFTQK